MKTLADQREEAGISQSTVARRLGKLRGWVSHVEKGRIGLSDEDREAYLDALRWGRIEKGLAEHQILKCPGCGQKIYDDPPGTGLFNPFCCCPIWAKV